MILDYDITFSIKILHSVLTMIYTRLLDYKGNLFVLNCVQCSISSNFENIHFRTQFSLWGEGVTCKHFSDRDARLR